jgi:hypothetical protein
MDVKTVLFIAVIIVLLIMLWRYISKEANTLSGLTSGKSLQKIEASSLPVSQLTGSSNFTYSIWFYIDDWNYRYGESKVLFGRMTTGKGEEEPCPSVVFAPSQNNVIVSLAVYPGLDNNAPTTGSNYIVHQCAVANIPIQRWVNLLISVYGRTLDIYIDGKLVRTCVLPGVAKIDNNAPIYITPAGGFSGWTSRFQYWPDSSDPQQAWNVYKSGYGGSYFSNIFGRYSVKVSILEGDVENSSWSI